MASSLLFTLLNILLVIVQVNSKDVSEFSSFSILSKPFVRIMMDDNIMLSTHFFGYRFQWFQYFFLYQPVIATLPHKQLEYYQYLKEP